MGIGNHIDQIHIINFGLVKRYWDVNTHAHFPYTINNSLTGTAAFASINNHQGLEQSHCNDLESLAYVLLYFLHGSLPWHSPGHTMNNVQKQQLKSMANSKVKSHPSPLCKAYPTEFMLFLNYCHALQYDEMPDYQYLWKLFSDLLVCEGHRHNYMFDWCLMSASPGAAVVSTDMKATIHSCKKQVTSNRVYVSLLYYCIYLIMTF